jgi:hypothetical protein
MWSQWSQRSRWSQGLAAAAVAVSAAVHLILWFDGVRHQHVVGPAFLLNAVGGAVIAALLLTRRHWLPPLLAVGFGISTLGAFVVSVTVGLFGVDEHWAGHWVWTATTAEVVAILAGAAAFLAATSHGPAQRVGDAAELRVPHLH